MALSQKKFDKILEQNSDIQDYFNARGLNKMQALEEFEEIRKGLGRKIPVRIADLTLTPVAAAAAPIVFSFLMTGFGVPKQEALNVGLPFGVLCGVFGFFGAVARLEKLNKIDYTIEELDMRATFYKQNKEAYIHRKMILQPHKKTIFGFQI